MTSDTLPGAPHAAEPERSPLDTLFAVLSEPHRRHVLTTLARAGPRDEGRFTLEELTPEDADHERFVVELYHVHLPVLAAADYVEWDQDAGTIRPGPAYGEIAACIDVLEANADDLPGEWP